MQEDWISVHHHLPASNIYVTVKTKEGKEYDARLNDVAGWWRGITDEGLVLRLDIEDEIVTHWKPMTETQAPSSPVSPNLS